MKHDVHDGPRWTYLSIQEAGGQFAFHTTAVSRVHPQQELPASGERDGHRVKDLFGVDAVEGKKTKKRENLYQITSQRSWIAEISSHKSLPSILQISSLMHLRPIVGVS